MTKDESAQIGVVAIGRNEGERLKRCLESVQGRAACVVYVDSGSTDGSVEAAGQLGAEVVELDQSIPFTAARARNRGVSRLLELLPGIEFIQVVDGDCRLVDGWLDAAVRAMRDEAEAAVVCGRRREVDPDSSPYNRLCDLEWDTPIGEGASCGGDALIRVRAFREVGGYAESLIAGEEPEMCLRMRRRGWKVLRIDEEMTLHDARMTRVNQWWMRMVRCGYAYAEGRALHGGSPDRYCVDEMRSIIEWALLLPLIALLAAWPTWGASLVLAGLYPLLWRRIRRRRIADGDSTEDAGLYASSCVIGKFAQLCGAARYWINRLSGRAGTIIEYKNAAGAEGPKRPGGGVLDMTESDRSQHDTDKASRPMRLAYLTTEYPKVSHTFIRREILELERRGHEVTRLAIRDSAGAIADPVDRQEQERTFHCLSQSRLRLFKDAAAVMIRHPRRWVESALMAWRMSRRSDRGLFRHIAYLVEAACLLRLVRQKRIEHLHVHFGTNAAAVARLMRGLGGPPYSFTVHGPDEFDAPVALALEEKVSDAAFVVAITDYCAAQLHRWARPEDWDKIEVVHCTVADEFFEQCVPIPEDSRSLVCVGRLSAQKGHLLLLDAVKSLHDQGVDLQLVLAGDGEMRAEVERRIEELNLRGNVSITGWISEQQVRQYLLSSRGLVLPSFAEGLPVVIMESLALGRPVITTRITGIPELVKDGENGRLVTAGNLQELQLAVRWLAETPVDTLEQMGMAGRQHVGEGHRVADEVDKLEHLFARVVSSREAA